MTTRHKRRDTILTISVLVLILALAAVLRLYDLGAQSLWYDEAVTAHVATQASPS